MLSPRNSLLSKASNYLGDTKSSAGYTSLDIKRYHREIAGLAATVPVLSNGVVGKLSIIYFQIALYVSPRCCKVTKTEQF